MINAPAFAAETRMRRTDQIETAVKEEQARGRPSSKLAALARYANKWRTTGRQLTLTGLRTENGIVRDKAEMANVLSRLWSPTFSKLPGNSADICFHDLQDMVKPVSTVQLGGVK